VFDADLNVSVGVDTSGATWTGLLRGDRDQVVVGATSIASDFGAEDAYEAIVVELHGETDPAGLLSARWSDRAP
jgi:hypothetical protein